MKKNKMTNKGSNLSVALLFKDLKDASEISRVFKKIGVHPYFYEDLKSFWAGTLENRPSLCLVDVTMMSEKNLILKNHPLIKSEELPISFYYTDVSAPLMYSTFEIFHLGLIKNSSSYAGQIKSILKRFNKMNTLVLKEHQLSVSNRHLTKKVEKLIINTEEIREKNTYNQLLTESTQKLSKLKTCENFEEALSLFLEDFDYISSFGMLELSHNCQKLVTSECFSLKFKKIPTLWLGKTCNKGIEAFAQVLASQVVMELIEGPMISLNIEGLNVGPEKIIYLKVEDEEFLNHFDWVGLERSLSSLYAHFTNKKNSTQVYVQQMKNPYELMSFLDAFQHGKHPNAKIPKGFSDEDYLLLDINLQNLVDLALSTMGKGRFYWQEFYKDFIIKLESSIKGSFEAIPMGVSHIGILVEKKDGEDYFSQIKKFVLRYPYWRYFEDADMILAREMKPEVKISPFSSLAYSELLSGELENLTFGKTYKKTKAREERSYFVDLGE